MIFIIPFIVIVLLILLVVSKWAKIKSMYVRWMVKMRRKHRAKFDFDDENQKQTIRIIERLIRDPNSKLERDIKTETYYVVCGDIIATFNSKYASILNGKFDNTTMLYDALFANLRNKYDNRKRGDVAKLHKLIDEKHASILKFIQEDIQEKYLKKD